MVGEICGEFDDEYIKLYDKIMEAKKALRHQVKRLSFYERELTPRRLAVLEAWCSRPHKTTRSLAQTVGLSPSRTAQHEYVLSQFFGVFRQDYPCRDDWREAVRAAGSFYLTQKEAVDVDVEA